MCSSPRCIWDAVFRKFTSTPGERFSLLHDEKYNRSLVAFPDLQGYVRRADAMVFMVCFNRFKECEFSSPRWRQYAEFHGHDFVILTSPSEQGLRHVSNGSMAVWDKINAAATILAMGYQYLLYVDGDSLPVYWRYSVHDFVANDTVCINPLIGNRHPKGPSSVPSFFWATEEAGKWKHYLSGPTNFGVLLFNNTGRTRTMLSFIREAQFLKATPMMEQTWGNGYLKR